jgi:CHAT domain-containing protein
LIWVISATRFEVVEKKISSDDLNSLVLEYAGLIARADQTKDEEVARAAKSLYEILVTPVEHLLDESRELCVIPDKVLFYLPFATLVSPSTNEYLLRRYTLLFSPSASVLIFCSIEAGRKAGGGETFLGVGNPTFDRARYPHLHDLPSARTEVMNAARHYDDPHCLVGSAALKESVEARMESANVLHFACHYVTDETSPMNSKLLLAKGDMTHSGDGTLSAREVSAKRLRQARLVVLSACQTSHEEYYNGEGTIGISRTFLAAGAPLVVASQWPVETESTAELMVNFHRLRKEGKLSTTSALRLAQLKMLDGPDERRRRPFYWAAFLAVGGHADY